MSRYGAGLERISSSPPTRLPCALLAADADKAAHAELRDLAAQVTAGRTR
jgi:hypothetical protein